MTRVMSSWHPVSAPAPGCGRVRQTQVRGDDAGRVWQYSIIFKDSLTLDRRVIILCECVTWIRRNILILSKHKCPGAQPDWSVVTE